MFTEKLEIAVLKNLIKPCVLTSVAVMKGTFDCFATLLPQSIMAMIQKKVTKTKKVARKTRKLCFGT